MTSGMAQTQAEAAVMAQTAGKFDQVNQSLTTMLNRLMTELAGLQTAWVGRGGTAFEAVKGQYQRDLTDLNAALAETAEAIRTSGAGYTATDEAAARLITNTGGNGSGGGYLPLEN